MSDKVHISGLQAQAIIGLDHWKKPVPHPVSIDVDFSTDFSKASETDNLHYSLNYAVISAKIASYLSQNEQKNFRSLGGLGAAVLRDALKEEVENTTAVSVQVSAPKVDIRAPVSFATATNAPPVYRIHGLRALTLIGVFTFERMHKQYVSLDIALGVAEAAPHLNVGQISESVSGYLESANFKTVEALVASSCQWIFQNFDSVESASVRVTKPNAIVYTEGVGVSCFYKKGDFADKPPLVASHNGSADSIVSDSSALSQNQKFDLPVETSRDYTGTHDVYLAFGSNSGDQLHNISEALRLLEEHPQITLKATSSLYVSKPMYYTEQPDFYNGVVLVEVENLAPHDLLAYVKKIEYEHLARVKAFENGPREIDLDIVFFGRETVTSPDLVVPHKAMLERTFVLQPLCELLPPDFTHPVTAEPVHSHLASLLRSGVDASVQESPKLVSVTPGTSGRMLRFNHDGSSATILMSIFNATPDSFSDGGQRHDLSPEQIVAEALAMQASGAEIIDVGGVSTRPGSSQASLEEEIARVLPVVKAIRSDTRLDKMLISVDTFRAAVAESVLAAGADIINDISMGLYDPAIFHVVAQYGCGYVMGHTRGTPATMTKLTSYGPPESSIVEYNIDERSGLMPLVAGPSGDVVNGVCRELAAQFRVAMASGVRKWQIILDPGVGFAKKSSQNPGLLRHCGRLKKYAQVDLAANTYTSFHGMAVLVGTSRKTFLGKLTGQADPELRVAASLASLTALVQQDVDIVRVHDVKESKEALQVADAIYKGLQ